MNDEAQRPTAPYNAGYVPRFGMYAGPNYAGGHALRSGELPDAAVWRVPPVGYLDDVTRNHDINYTYIEQTYKGNDPASQTARTQALWQADKEMLAGMLRHQPGNWLESQYRSAAIEAFVAKADMNYRPAVDVVGDWNRELADIDPQFPALQASEQGRARWSLPSLVHGGATYTSTGMEALSTSGVNSQAAVLFNTHIQPRNIAPLTVLANAEFDNADAEREFSRRLMIPQRDSEDLKVFTAQGQIHGKEVHVWYHSVDHQMVRTVSSNGQIESQTTYQGTEASGPAGKKYGHADFTVTRQSFQNGQPHGEPETLPPVKAAAVADLEQAESAHTRDIKVEVLKGKEAQFPSGPTAADKAWHSGQPSAATTSLSPSPSTSHVATPLSPDAQRLLSDSERHVRALSEKHQLPWDRGMDNTVAAVARHAQAQGLSRIDHLVVQDGQIRYASHDGGILKEGSLGARQAANVPQDQSLTALTQASENNQSNTAVNAPVQAAPHTLQSEPPVVSKVRA